MELAASLPAERKVHRTRTKAIFRDAVSAWLPRELLDRPKMGFEVPLAHWFRNELRGYVKDVLLDPQTVGRGYFRPSHVERLLERHMLCSEDNSDTIWALLVAELWHREYVDQAASGNGLSSAVRFKHPLVAGD
jgi:asparagine synthase (glutamine-hydrolysing)